MRDATTPGQAFYRLRQEGNCFCSVIRSFENALPNINYMPAHGPEFVSTQKIAVDIPANLGSPKFTPRRWPFKKRTVMAMPEAAIHKNDDLPFWKHDVRLSGKILAMQPKSIAQRVQAFSDDHFRSGILSPDTGHHLATLFLRYDVSHSLRPAQACPLQRVRTVRGPAP